MTGLPTEPAGRRSRSPRDRWLIAYSDMITLLLACFASLYAATLDQGAQAASAKAAAPVPSAMPATAPHKPTPSNLRLSLERAVQAHDDLTAVDVTDDARGLVVSLPEAGSFPIGRAEPTVAAQAILADIAATVLREHCSIRIEGHTDDVPMQSAEFASNWELSTARATRVVQFLIERAGIAPARLSAAGYGQFKPRVANDTAEGRARNRRVDIVLVTGDAGDAAVGGGAR